MMDLSALSRHKNICLSFSGGKDSFACVYLFRPLSDRIKIYHMDTGDLLPEMMDIVEHVKSFWPNFVHIKLDIFERIKANGMPSDLIPHSMHPLGHRMEEAKTPLVSRYDCCFQNRMWPIYERIKADGNTLVIRGTRRSDMNRFPAESGSNLDGVEILLPIQDWSTEDVFAYLRSVDAPICRFYEHSPSSPDCARCTAFWNEKRAAYLKKYHPALFEDYAARMRLVAAEIDGPLRHFAHEMEGING